MSSRPLPSPMLPHLYHQRERSLFATYLCPIWFSDNVCMAYPNARWINNGDSGSPALSYYEQDLTYTSESNGANELFTHIRYTATSFSATRSSVIAAHNATDLSTQIADWSLWRFGVHLSCIPSSLRAFVD